MAELFVVRFSHNLRYTSPLKSKVHELFRLTGKLGIMEKLIHNISRQLTTVYVTEKEYQYYKSVNILDKHFPS